MMRFQKLNNLGTVLLIVLFMFGSSGQVFSARASTLAGTLITVTTTEDALVTNGNCALREAVRAANTDIAVDACPAGSGADTINILAGNYPLQIPGPDENNAMTGDLDITSNVHIQGAGSDLTTIDGAGLDRIFHITKGAVVSIKYLAIEKGMAIGTDLNGGGGIFNEQGTLTIDQCRVIGNRTTNIGGGIDNLGTLYLSNSTISGNEAKKGGGVFNGGTLTFESSTVIGNTALETGGGLDNGDNGVLTNITIGDNKANGGGGGLFNDAVLTIVSVTLNNNTTAVANNGSIRFRNTLIANSTAGPNCTGLGTLTSEGNNLDSGASCKFTISTDLQNSDPLLGPLDDNKGPTLTYALQAGSPAIDAGGIKDMPPLDQRGAIRPADGNDDGERVCDIGAYELGASFPEPIFLPMVKRK